jgi:hypothetical protein
VLEALEEQREETQSPMPEPAQLFIGREAVTLETSPVSTRSVRATSAHRHLPDVESGVARVVTRDLPLALDLHGSGLAPDALRAFEDVLGNEDRYRLTAVDFAPLQERVTLVAHGLDTAA